MILSAEKRRAAVAASVHMPEQQSDASIGEHAVRLYRLLRGADNIPSFEEARDKLGLTDEVMRQVVRHLSAALDKPATS